MQIRAEKYALKKARLMAPHLWFAWRPVKLESGNWAWLETVVRWGEYSGYTGYWFFEYRSKPL